MCPSFEDEVFVWTDENEEYVCDACEAPILVNDGVPLHSNVVEISCIKYPDRLVVVPIDGEDHLECPHCGADIDVQDHEAIHAGRPRGGTNRGRSAPPRLNDEADSELHHARVLGLQGRITVEYVKRCYRERMREYHPDKVAALGPKLRALAEEETKQINAAYEFFIDRYGSRPQA